MEIDQWEARMENLDTTNRFREFLSRENNTFRILSKNADLSEVPNMYRGISQKLGHIMPFVYSSILSYKGFLVTYASKHESIK